MARRGQTRLFKTGTKVDLFVTSVQPGVGRFCHFWAQSDIESQLAVEELMNAVESKVAHTSCPQIVRTDELCLAKFQGDGKWYRSKVVDCRQDGSRSPAKVFFIDYGNSENVPLSELRTNMHEYFANYPPQAKEFVLADLLPSDGIHWSEREVEYLNDHLSYGEFSAHVLATVCGKIPLVRLMNNDDKTQPLVLKFPSANIGKSYNNTHFLKSEFPRNELPLSTDLEAFVTYSLSPVKFWIQLASDEEQLNQLRLLMEAQYGNLSDRDLVCNFIDEGTLCAGVCSIDGSFYRAVVEECRTDGFCRTFFIDYGNSETASIQNFRFKILPDQLKSVPAYAFECTLAGIPPGMHMTDIHIAIFRDLVNDTAVKAQVLSVNGDGVYTVALFDRNGISIVDFMKLGSVKPLPKVVPAVKPVVQKPPQVPAPDCAVGTEEDVFITLVESPDKFFGQLVKYSGEVLNEFQNTLMEHYEANNARIPHLSSPSVGDYCCAKYTVDDMWYRAQVTAIAGNKLDLFFIDYGDKETGVRVAEVKVLDPRFVNLPQQGIFLKMTAPVDKSKFEEIIDRRITLKLENKLGGNYYSTTFSEKNERNVLQLLLEPQACQAPSQTQSTMQRARFKESVIDPAKAEAVSISHVNHPESFYCQLSKTEESLNQLMDDIHNIYSKLDPMGGLLQSLIPGTPCVAQFTEDQGWYRASVLAGQGDKVKVFYVDYGNSEELPKSCVRIMDPRFLLLPAQAIHCTMHSISYVGTWPPECVTQFEEMVTAGSCTASFLGFDDKRSAYEVELLDANGVNINEKFGKATRTLVRAAPPPSAAPTQAPSSPQRRPPGIMYQKIDLPVGVFKDVAVVHTETPSEFYCQLIESAPALNDLMDRIDALYTKLGPTDRGVRNPVKGMPCCAKFTEDDVWYRAEITDILGNIITVQFVDYGNGETLSVERVKELKPEFLQLGAQAIKCCMKEIRPKGGEWSDAAIDRFTDLTDEKNLVGSVIKKLPDGTVEMELLDTESDLNIGQELCKIGDCVGPASVPVPMANSNAMRPRSSSGSSSGSNPPRQRTSPHEPQMSDRATANKGGFGGRQPSGGRSDSNDWREPAGNRFLDRLAGGDEEAKPYRRPEWPGEREPKGRTFGNGDSNSRSHGSSNKGDDWGDGGSSSSFGGPKQERSFGKGGNRPGFGGDRNAAEKRSFGQTAITEPVPPYKEVDLSVGKKHSVLITWNETTCDFWCQLSDNQADIGKMMVSIQGEYNRKKSEYTFTNPTTGSPCMALYAGDRAWYRGKITKVEFGSCKVLFVDYGNQEEIQKSNVVRMKPEFMSLPIQGIHCQLQGVKPVSEKWTEESKRKYQKIMTEAQPLQFIFKGKSGGVFKVETEVTSRLLSASLVSSTSPAPTSTPVAALIPAAVAPSSSVKKYKVLNKNGRHQGFISQLDSPGKFFMQLKDEESLVTKITEKLVQLCEGPAARSLKVNKAPPVGVACVAKYAEDGAHYRAIVESLSGSKICVRFVDFGNAEMVDLSEIFEMNDSLLIQTPLAYECTFAAGATWSDADGDQMHNLTADKELTVEFVTRSAPFVVKLFDGQTDISSQFKPMSIAGVTSYPSKSFTSKKELGYVSHVDSLTSFYVQLASEEDDLVTLSDQLQESYNAGSTQLTEPGVGSPCVTRFSDDNGWYRAVVTQAVAGKVTVRFVDYGNGEDVNLQDIKALKTEFSSVPPFAVQCRLPTDKSSQADADKFSEQTAEKQLTFHFSSSEPYVVKVFDGPTDIGAAFSTTERITPASFPKQNISCGVHKVYVSHIENPDQFFVQLVSEEGQLDMMTTSLTQIALTDLPEIPTPEVGMPCIAEFSEDSALYRGVITKVSADNAEVRFSDFGNTDIVLLSSIRAVTDSFTNMPPIAIKCTLGIGQTWDQDAVDKFSGVVMDVAVSAEFITNSVPCKVKLTVDGTDVASSLGMEPVLAYSVQGIPKAPQNGYTSHVVSVKQFYIQLASDENALESLSEKLNSMCEALPRVTTATAGMVCGSKFSEDESWYRAEVVSVLPGNKAKVVFVDYGNTDEVDVGSLRILPADLVQKPLLAFECKLEEGITNNEENINKLTNMTVDKELKVEFLSSSKPIKVRLFVEGKDVAESLAGDTSPATDSPKYPEYMLTGNKHKACVCHVESPAQFYIQMVADDSKLNELMDQLDGHYSANASVLPQVTEGVACVCRYSEDNGWYRGKVVARCDATVTVQFVDYGNCEDKSVKEVYSLVQQFSILPQFALECTIGNAAFSKEETDKFQTLTNEKELDVTFANETTPYAVQLFDGATDLTAEFKKESSPGFVATSAPVLKYPRQVITKGTHKGYVSHVDSLTQFYIQLQSQEDALNSLAEQLDSHYGSNTATHLEIIAEGVSCTTLYSGDGHWYRGMITGIGHDIATVQFIDYGNSEDVSHDAVKVLAADFISQPPFGYRCSIGDNATFTPEDSDAFTEQTAEKLLDVEFCTDVLPYIVKISEDSECLTSKYFAEDGSEVPASDPAVELFSTAGEGQEPKPEPVADTHESSTTVPAGCKYFKYQSYPEGSTDDFFVAVTKSPGQFWCQKTSDEGQLAELTDSILADETLVKGSMVIDDIHIGAAYLAKFTEDDCWYRATVLTMDATSCSVLFVDYGNQEVVLYENISPADDKYLELPACAVECFLSGASWTWTSEATEKFSEIVADKNVSMRCLSTASSSLGAGFKKFGVSLIVDEADIVEKLIEESPAKVVTELREQKIQLTEEPSLQSTDDVELQYARTEVKLENKYEVTVSFVTSPNQFSLQCSNAQASLDALMAKIDETYAELSESDRRLQHPSVGQPCVVKYSEDGSWYRGQIEKVLEGNRVEVYFVDYGSSEETDLSCIKTIESSMVEQPMYAMECFHAGMKSIEGPWSAKAIEIFSNLVLEKKLICEFLSQETDCDSPCYVQLYDMGISVMDKMVEEGVAERTAEALGHFLDTSLLEPNAPTPQESEDVAAPIPLENASEEMKQAIEKDAEPKVHYIEYKMPQLDPGSKIDVFVTSVTNPTDFWCQLADSSEDLPLLMDTFHEYCHDNKDAHLEDELVECLPCIACTQEGEDQAWYRAKVIKARDEDVNVCLVDYGNMEDVSRDKLYKLQQEHTDLPLQAFKCSLKDVKPIGENWDVSACTRFEELTYDKKLKLEITDVRGQGPLLVVLGILEEGEESVLKKLIDEGYAEVQDEEAFSLAEDSTACATDDARRLDERDEFQDAEAEVADDATGNEEVEVLSEVEEGSSENQEAEVVDDATGNEVAEVADDTIEYDEAEVLQKLDDDVIGKSSEGIDVQGNVAEEAGDFKEAEIDADAVEAIRELDDVLEKEGAADEPENNGGPDDMADLAETKEAGEGSGHQEPGKPLKTGEGVESEADAELDCNAETKEESEEAGQVVAAKDGDDDAEIADSVMQEFARNTVENIIFNAREVLQSESQEDTSEKLSSLHIIADDKLPVVFTHGTSPHDFYLQPKSSSELLSNLMQEIASWCEMEEATEFTPSVGDACLAHGVDDQWYRARIMSVDKEEYQVVFIDTGMKATVNQIRPIPDEFQSLPCQAVRCRLGGVKETHSSMNKHVKETFMEMCLENLLSRFVEKLDDGYYSVYLYNSEDDVESVNLELVEAFGLDVVAGSELEIAAGNVEADMGSEKGDSQENWKESPEGQVNGTEGEEVNGSREEVHVKSSKLVTEEVEPTEPTDVSTE
ncbi:uncharacterized protein LOC135487163 isoform X2 [Lineus longissimus]|uniref:uncharacterized protein LOC135487163 isoform X2 n=1 Tax=Lineus longissimus TaxID=88925 RepID=UPI00315D98C6